MMGSMGASLRYDRGTLLLEGLDGQTVATIFVQGLWTWDPRVSAWRCEAVHYAAVRDALRAHPQLQIDDEIPPPPRVGWKQVALPELRPEQKSALEAWQAAGSRGVVVMPTGTGKTEVAFAAMAEARVSTLVVAPVRDLMYQWHRRILRAFDYDAGIIGDNTFNQRSITVTTYDSAYIHMPVLGTLFGLVIFDEVHHLPGKCRREAALLCAAPLRLGLTATPERSDGRHVDLEQLIGPMVFRMSVAEAKGRTLADYNVVRVPVALTDEEQARYEEASRDVRLFMAAKQRDQKGYSWEDLCAESGKDPEARRVQKSYFLMKSIEDRAAEKIRVLEDIFRLHAGERVIVFAGSNAMARDVSLRFLVPTLLSHSRKTERLQVLEGFAAGRFPVIVANQVLDEGVDVPEAKVAVVIGGHASTRQAKQRLGRILRRSGEAMATLYEVVCEDTHDVKRSRQRRRSDAYRRPRHRRL
jgi:superfamily II DNA or RNA helicase